MQPPGNQVLTGQEGPVENRKEEESAAEDVEGTAAGYSEMEMTVCLHSEIGGQRTKGAVVCLILYEGAVSEHHEHGWN